MEIEKKETGVLPDADGKIVCTRCGKRLADRNFYVYRNGKKCEICKPCLTAHIDNFNPDTFLWVLEKLDIPYIPIEWNVLRDRAFAKNPYKMTGLSVIGKYLAKMKLSQWNKYGFADSEKAQLETEKRQDKKIEDKKKYEADLKAQLEEGQISEAEYKTLVSTETQKEQLPKIRGNAITGDNLAQFYNSATAPMSYAEALTNMKNPFIEGNFISEDQMVDPAADLDKQDRIYLAMKWGRTYTASQHVTLEQMYNEFMNSFDIQGAARIDTLKMICKTSLKMNQAIDQGDIDTYQKLSRVYDSMMKSAKFTEAQNKSNEGAGIDSASAIVDFVEAHSGQIPKYDCSQPQDIVDSIILDLKAYTRNLIYEDKALAQEIEKYLQNKRISDAMKEDKMAAKQQGLEKPELDDFSYIEYKEALAEMKQHDSSLDESVIEEEYQKKGLVSI